MPHSPHDAPQVTIIGGGLAGLAAAVAACERGLRVELLEMRQHLGGRAGSFRDPQSGEWLDHCQHVAMGCCTNFLDLCRRTGLTDCFRRDRRLHFFGPDGRRCDFAPWTWLPAPLHLGPALWRQEYLSWRDRWAIGRSLLRLARLQGVEADGQTMQQWLAAEGQSDEAVDRFWSLVIVSALSETPERVSLAAGRKVFVDGLMASGSSYELVLPRVPLAEIYDRRLARWLGDRGVAIRRGVRACRLQGDARRVVGIQQADGTTAAADHVILAVPWRQAAGLLDEGLLVLLPQCSASRRLEAAAISAVHLWFDRPVISLPHAVLVGRMSQWVFRRGDGSACQVVVSAAHAVARQGRDAVVAEVLGDLRTVWPEVRRARLIRSRLAIYREAVFSPRPGAEGFRPPQSTAVENLALAGDWTATGWPATMESAVRSGYRAAESVLQRLGHPQAVLVADPAPSWAARWLWGR